MFPSVWSSFSIVKVEQLGILVSGVILNLNIIIGLVLQLHLYDSYNQICFYFFTPSGNTNNSNLSGAFIN